MSNLDDTLWGLVNALGKHSECLDKKVGCIIYNTKTNEVAARGWNMHLDGVCDCDTTKTAQHAEITAIHDLYLPTVKEDLIAFINHKPCLACSKALDEYVSEVRYRSQH